MKKILKSLFAAGLMLAAVGCDQDQIAAQFNPAGEDASTAWFAQSAVSYDFPTTATGEQTINVDIYRQSAEGDLNAGLWYEMSEGADEFLSVPESIFFKDGEYKATLPVMVSNVENFLKGTTYSVTIGVGDYHEFKDVELAKAPFDPKQMGRTVDSDTFSTITVSTALELIWEPMYILKDPSKLLDDSASFTEADYVLGEDGKPMLQTASMTIAIFNPPYNLHTDIVMERAAGTTVFRLVEPYAAVDGFANFIFTVDTAEDHMLTIDGNKYYRCVVTGQNTEIAYDETNDVWLTDLNTFGGYSYDDYPCYWDGKRDFYFDFLWYITSGGQFGVFTENLSMDAGVAPDPEPEVAISYEGVETSATGLQSYKLSFAPNADVAKYYATVLPFDIENEIPLTPEQEAAIAAAAEAATIQFLNANGVFDTNPQWALYMQVYYPQFYEPMAAEFAAGLVSEYLGKVQAEIEEGTYKGEQPVLELTKASTEAWVPGAAGMYTAVAFSYDKSGKFSNIDYQLFIHNPEGLANMVTCDYTFDISNGEYTAPGYAWGKFNDNAIYVDFYGGFGVTAIKYATLTAEEFAAAGFTDASTDADFIAYLAEKGKALGAADLADVNDVNGEDAYFWTFIDAQPATEYYLIAAISDADATKVVVDTVKTEDAVEGSFALEAYTREVPQNGYYHHTHVYARFTGTHVCGADYLVDSAASFKDILVKNEDGSFSLAKDVTDADIIALIEENGNSLSSGYSSSNPSDLQYINTVNDYTSAWTAVRKPNTEFYVLACYDLTGEGCKNWVAKSVTTAFAPAVAFTQTVTVNGNNLLFNWSAAPTASIFAVTQIDYALVAKADLEAAGVDLSKIADNDLNNLEAQLAAGGDEAALEAAAANVAKIAAVLAENGKSFEGDAAYAVNGAGGVSKQFSNLEAGEYALISVAYDTYNTKLTVSLASIQ